MKLLIPSFLGLLKSYTLTNDEMPMQQNLDIYLLYLPLQCPLWSQITWELINGVLMLHEVIMRKKSGLDLGNGWCLKFCTKLGRCFSHRDQLLAEMDPIDKGTVVSGKNICWTTFAVRNCKDYWSLWVIKKCVSSTCCESTRSCRSLLSGMYFIDNDFHVDLCGWSASLNPIWWVTGSKEVQ